MKRKHYLVLLLVIGLLVMSLFGCASQKDSTPDAGEPDETGQKTIDYPKNYNDNISNFCRRRI